MKKPKMIFFKQYYSHCFQNIEFDFCLSNYYFINQDVQKLKKCHLLLLFRIKLRLILTLVLLLVLHLLYLIFLGKEQNRFLDSHLKEAFSCLFHFFIYFFSLINIQESVLIVFLLLHQRWCHLYWCWWNSKAESKIHQKL